MTYLLPIVILIGVIATMSWAQTAETVLSARGWKEHHIKRADDQGGWISHPAQIQFIHRGDEEGNSSAYGLAQMDNGEVVLAGTWRADSGGEEKTAIAFSRDRGETWSEFEPIGDVNGRPMMLAYLGQGNLTFEGDNRWLSNDYGQTWSAIPMQPAENGGLFLTEGNPLVDRNPNGIVTRMAEIGFNWGEPGRGRKFPDPASAFIRWSNDGGRTWVDEVEPPTWRWQQTFNGESITRSVSEGSVVRAKNGWLVAALRTDMPPRYLANDSDHYEGTGVSVSKDEGRTWSPIEVLFEAGRMHAHLLRQANGDLVMTLIVRVDVRDGTLASYRRGCEAIVSQDNGLTWDLDRKYILDDWTVVNPNENVWEIGSCGHVYSALLDDNSILTAFNNYVTKGISLVRWRR